MTNDKQPTTEELKPILQDVTEEEMQVFATKQNRDRYNTFPDRLPTKDRMPLPPDEHKYIGLYESKQNLYLLTAHAYNRIMGRTDYLLQKIEELEARIKALEGGM